MKLKHFFLFLIIFLTTIVVTVFICDLVHNLNSASLINGTSDVGLNNQIVQLSERDVQNVTQTINSNISDSSETNTTDSTTVYSETSTDNKKIIIIVSVVVGIGLSILLGNRLYYYCMMKAINQRNSGEFPMEAISPQ